MIIYIVFGVTALMLVAGWLLDRADWNNGVCHYNGIKWEPCGVDWEGYTEYEAGIHNLTVRFPFIISAL